jgi:RNA polymerase sigma-70 factor (ECF subfamily)
VIANPVSIVPSLPERQAAKLPEDVGGVANPRRERVAAGDFVHLLEEARTGSPAAIGRLFEHGRAFLEATARQRIPSSIRQKLGASDVVQETAIDFQRDFLGFQGTTEGELLAWLRRVLLNNLTDAVRRYQTAAQRNVARERPIHGLTSQKSPLHSVAVGRTPEESVIRREDAALVKLTLGDLPEHYREVLMLRYWDQCSFPEIGLRMNRSAEAARKLWFRAIGQFNLALAERRSADIEGRSPSAG